MDRKKLEKSLQLFKEACQKVGRPLNDICIYEAYPGDVSTSYIIQVKAPWVDEMDCSEAIEFLFDILWENSDENVRKHIFSIEILDSNDQSHCYSESAAHLESLHKD